MYTVMSLWRRRYKSRRRRDGGSPCGGTSQFGQDVGAVGLVEGWERETEARLEGARWLLWSDDI